MNTELKCTRPSPTNYDLDHVTKWILFMIKEYWDVHSFPICGTTIALLAYKRYLYPLGFVSFNHWYVEHGENSLVQFISETNARYYMPLDAWNRLTGIERETIAMQVDHKRFRDSKITSPKVRVRGEVKFASELAKEDLENTNPNVANSLEDGAPSESHPEVPNKPEESIVEPCSPVVESAIPVSDTDSCNPNEGFPLY